MKLSERTQEKWEIISLSLGWINEDIKEGTNEKQLERLHKIMTKCSCHSALSHMMLNDARYLEIKNILLENEKWGVKCTMLEEALTASNEMNNPFKAR